MGKASASDLRGPRLGYPLGVRVSKKFLGNVRHGKLFLGQSIGIDETKTFFSFFLA